MTDVLKDGDYTASVHYSANDEVFYGKINGINDLVTFDGVSVKELKSAFKEAVNDYVETCKSLNKDPEKSYKGVFNVRVPAALHRKAAVLADENNMSLNDLVKTSLDYAISHQADLLKRH